MFKKEAQQLKICIGLEREIVGIKFIFIKEEYDDLNVNEFNKKSSFCSMTYQAMEGNTLKAKEDSFICRGGPETLGMDLPDNYILSGKQFSTFKLYDSLATARKVQNELSFINQKIYGVLVGPLKDLEDADVVMFLANGRQVMRIIQAYTYKYSMPKNIGMIGNQGICSDLVSRPYKENDLNLSALCDGARMHTKADDGEMGIGMPINLFKDIVDGLIYTTNPALDNKEKKLLEDRMKESDILDLDIEYDKMYVSYAKDMKYNESLYRNKE